MILNAWASASIDALLLMLLWVPGILVARMMGLRAALDTVVVGFLISTAVATSTFLVQFAFGFPEGFLSASRVILVVATASTLFFARKHLVNFHRDIGLVVTLIGFGVGARNILKLDGWMHGYDHVVTVVAASLIQTGDLTDQTMSEAVYKKGLGIPVLLALGQQGLLLGAVIPIVFVLTLLASFRMARVLQPEASRMVVVAVWLFAIAIWWSAPMFWGFAFYQHGHVLVALCVTVMTAVLARLSREKKAAPVDIAIFSIAGFVLAQARFEGFLIALIMVVAFVCLGDDSRTIGQQFLIRLTVSLTPILSFASWTLILGNFPVPGVSATLVAGALVGGAALLAFATSFSQALRLIVFFLSGGALVLGAAAFLRFYQNGLSGQSFVENMFGTTGSWGVAWWLVSLAVLVLLISRPSRVNTVMLWLFFSLLAFSVLGKLLDSLGTGGGIRAGWGDSVNRSVFHVFAPATAVVILAISEGANLITSVGQKVGRWKTSREVSEADKPPKPLVS